MGNSQNQQMEGERFEKIIQKFKFLQEINDPQLQKIKIYELIQDPSQRIFQLVKYSTSDQEFDHLKKHFTERKEWRHTNIVKILMVETNVSAQLCSDNSSINVLGEYFSRSLEDDYQETVSIKQIFNESYLWFLTYQIVQGCEYIINQGTFHGDIRLKNILKNPDGEVKLIEHKFQSNGKNSYQQALFSDEILYIAPELLGSLYMKNTDVKADFGKADVFSLGMMLLEIASQQSSATCYDWPFKKLHTNVIQERLARLGQIGYSRMFQNLINQMISEVDDRPGFTDLIIVLENFKEAIISHQPFYNQGQSRVYGGYAQSVYVPQ
ncbi:hypothetical protein pb186bvf_012036 [Paramecium bursaria]